MSYKGPWQEAAQCDNCGLVVNRQVKWMEGIFVPVCPKCGASNGDRFQCIFSPVTVRPVRSRWLRRFVRWEHLNPEEVHNDESN